MEKTSLGLIETLGWVPAVEAADAGTKTADVRLVGMEQTGRGLVTIKFLGDVAAVQAAVSAGAAAAENVGRVVSVHVIPRPDKQLQGALQAGSFPFGDGCDLKQGPEQVMPKAAPPVVRQSEGPPIPVSPDGERSGPEAADPAVPTPDGSALDKRKAGRKRQKPNK